MRSSSLYDNHHFVILTPQQPEEIVTSEEMLTRLETILQSQTVILPPDIQKLPSLAEKAQHLIKNVCELTLESGDYFQWYAIRLEK